MDLTLVGLILTPFLLIAILYREVFIVYFMVLDSWIILRISQITFMHPALSLNKVLTVFALLVIWAKRVARGESILPRQLFSALSFTVIVFLSYLSYSFYSYTGTVNTQVFNNLVFYYLCILLLDREITEKFNVIALIVAFVVALLALSALVNNFISADFGQRSIAGNRNHTAFYVLEGVIFLFAYTRTGHHSKFFRLVLHGIIAFGLISIVMSLGRAITTITLSCMAFYFLKGYIKPRVIVMGFFLMVLVVGFKFDTLMSFKNKLFRIPDGTHHSVTNLNKDELGAFTSGRSAAYEVAWKLYLRQPLTGIGYDRWATDIMKGAAGSSLHSRWLQILIETGPPGALMYLGIYILCFYYLWKVRRRRGYRGSGEQQIARALMVGLYAFFLFGLTDNHGYTDRIFYLFLALTNVLFSTNKRGFGPNPVRAV